MKEQEITVMKKKNNTSRGTAIFKKLLCLLTIASLVAAWIPQAVLADTGSPAAIQDSYEINGINYFKMETSDFSKSDLNFLNDILSTKAEQLGGKVFTVGSMSFDLRRSLSANWKLVSQEIWKNADSYSSEISMFLEQYMNDELDDELEESSSAQFGSTPLTSASSIKQAENLILKKISKNGDMPFASGLPSHSDLLEKAGLFQSDTTDGPVFFMMDYGGMKMMGCSVHAVVFSDFSIKPILPENVGDNYISSVVEDVSTDEGAHASDAKNNTGLTAQISQSLTTTYTGTVTSEINGSSSYSYGNTISVGVEPTLPLVGSVSFNESFTMSKEIQNGWSKSEASSQEHAANNEVSVELPPYTGVMIKQTKKTKQVVTRYNCPVSVSYRVRVLDYGHNVFDKGKSKLLADIGGTAHDELRKRAVINVGHIDTDGLNWSKIRQDEAANAAIIKLTENVPISSTTASFTEKLSTVENVIDLQMPLLPLKTIEMKNQSDEVEMKPGDTLRVDTIGLSGLNERKSPYYGFNKDFGKWVLIDGSGKELTDGSIAKLTRNAVTGNVILTAAAQGTVYLKYLIDENRYGILSHPGIYAKNADLAKTAMIEIRVKGADAAVPSEAKPVTELTLPRNAVSPENPVSSKTNEKEVFAAKKDKDTKGSTFSLLQAKGAPKSKSSIKLSWKKVPGAKNYIIYGSPCGRGIKKITTVKGTSYTQKKLNKGKYYKYVIAAVNGGNTLATSKTIHVATKGGKVGNNTGVKLSKKKVTLRPGTSAKVTAKLIAGELKVNIHRKIAWESGNISIATVKNGKIKGVKPGTCYVYAYAQNGVTAKIKVTVK